MVSKNFILSGGLVAMAGLVGVDASTKRTHPAKDGGVIVNGAGSKVNGVDAKVGGAGPKAKHIVVTKSPVKARASKGGRGSTSPVTTDKKSATAGIGSNGFKRMGSNNASKRPNNNASKSDDDSEEDGILSRGKAPKTSKTQKTVKVPTSVKAPTSVESPKAVERAATRAGGPFVKEGRPVVKRGGSKVELANFLRSQGTGPFATRSVPSSVNGIDLPDDLDLHRMVDLPPHAAGVDLVRTDFMLSPVDHKAVAAPRALSVFAPPMPTLVDSIEYLQSLSERLEEASAKILKVQSERSALAKAGWRKVKQVLLPAMRLKKVQAINRSIEDVEAVKAELPNAAPFLLGELAKLQATVEETQRQMDAKEFEVRRAEEMRQAHAELVKTLVDTLLDKKPKRSAIELVASLGEAVVNDVAGTLTALKHTHAQTDGLLAGAERMAEVKRLIVNYTTSNIYVAFPATAEEIEAALEDAEFAKSLGDGIRKIGARLALLNFGADGKTEDLPTYKDAPAAYILKSLHFLVELDPQLCHLGVAGAYQRFRKEHDTRMATVKELAKAYDASNEYFSLPVTADELEELLNDAEFSKQLMVNGVRLNTRVALMRFNWKGAKALPKVKDADEKYVYDTLRAMVTMDTELCPKDAIVFFLASELEKNAHDYVMPRKQFEVLKKNQYAVAAKMGGSKAARAADASGKYWAIVDTRKQEVRDYDWDAWTMLAKSPYTFSDNQVGLVDACLELQAEPGYKHEDMAAYIAKIIAKAK